MSRKNRIPPYRRHPNGYAFVYHQKVASKDHRYYLGKHGTEESLRRYRQFLRRLEACLEAEQIPAIDPTPLVHELILAYDDAARVYYRRPEGLAQEYDEMRYALRFLAELYGDELACEIGPKCLKTIQRYLAQKDYARSHINKTISRIKRLFRWACEEELIPSDHYHKLTCVRGLQRGEQGARESKRVMPACPASVEAVAAFLSPVVTAMMQTQYLCGMRPCEVCVMRGADLDRSGEIWWYRPKSHKNEWRGHSLVKAIPKAAQEVLEPFVEAGEGGYLFCPLDSLEWSKQQVALKTTRKTPRYPSEVKRLAREKELRQRRVKKRKVGEHYTTSSYRRALTKGFAKAEREGVVLERFTPNQLRHAILTFISGNIGQQAAQRYAGHKRLETTSIYVEVQKQELELVARQLDTLWSA